MALCHRKAVGIGLGADEALEGLGIGILGNGEGLAGCLDDSLAFVEVGHSQGDIEFGIACTLLFGSLCCLDKALGGEVGITALAPVLQGDGQGDGGHILTEQMAIGIGKAVGHLVQTDAGVETHAEVLLHAGSLGLTTGFGCGLTTFQILGIILAGIGDGLGGIDMQRTCHHGDDEFDIGSGLHVEIGGQLLGSTDSRDAGIGECGAGIGLFQLEDAEFGLRDAGNLVATLGDGIDGVARGQVFLCHALHVLGQGEGKELGHSVLAGCLDAISQFFLGTLQLQGLYLAVPLQGVIEEQVLLIAHGDGDGHKLGLVLVAKGAQIAQLRGAIELSAPGLHGLGGGDACLRIERALLAILVDILGREVALGHIALIHGGRRLQGKLGLARGLPRQILIARDVIDALVALGRQ